MDTNDSTSLDLVDFLLRLDVLKNSEKATHSLIEALYVESDIELIYAYLLLLEKFVDINTQTALLLKLAGAVSYILFCKLLLVQSAFRNSDENAKIILEFISTVFEKVSNLIFEAGADEKAEEMLKNWTDEKSTETFSFSVKGLHRSVPVNFLNAILILLGLRFDPMLCEIWLDKNKFIPTVNYEPPKHLANFLVGCEPSEISNFGLSRLSPTEIIQNVSWFDLPQKSRNDYLNNVETRMASENFEIAATELTPSISLALTFTKLHLSSGGGAGKKFEKSLEKSLSRINQRSISPLPTKKDVESEKMDVFTEKSNFGKLSLVEDFETIFESKHQNPGAVRQFISRLDKEKNFDDILKCLQKSANSADSLALVHHSTMFSNVYKRLVQKLKQEQQVEKIRPLNDILKKICDDDANVKKSPGLKTLRILTKEVTKKLSETSKVAPSTETKILKFLDAKSPRDKIEAICEALKNEKDSRICGFLADLFIENNYDMLNVLPDEELKLFFSSVSNLPQLQSLFLQNARWETIDKCIDLLLSESTEGVKAEAVLNFLWAVERIRLLWKGKEMGAQRAMQFILKFSVKQMMKYISYFISECIDQKCTNLLDFRLTQMFHFMRGSNFSATDFINLTKMVQEQHDNAMNGKLWKDLLTMLYLYEPKAQNIDHDDVSTTNSTICSTDRIIYRVILDLAEIGEGARISEKMRDAHLFAIAVATSHPQLLLRHLPLLARLSKGRTHHDYKDFKNQRHLDFFTNFSTLMVLLDKQLFRPVYRVHLIEIINDFIQFMAIYPRQARRQCRKCSLFTLHLLRKFLEFDFAAAAAIIRSKKDLWIELRQVYPDMGGTNREIGLLIQLCHDMDKAPSVADKALMRLTINNMSGAISREQKSKIETLINGNIAEDIEQGVNLIREIGEERGGSVIFTYADHLLTKLGPESKCRRVAFEALLLIIRSDPKKCAHLFVPMMNSLGEGIDLLLGKEQEFNIMEFVVLFMPQSEEVLRRIFELGHSKGISVAQTIGRSIQLLSLLPSF